MHASKSSSASKTPSDLECFGCCGKIGHFVAQCPASHKWQMALKSKADGESQATETLPPVAESIAQLAEHHCIEPRARQNELVSLTLSLKSMRERKGKGLTRSVLSSAKFR